MRRTHGEANNVSGTRTRLYIIWCHMIERCENSHNERYAYYGGRGITVCAEWRNSYEKFREWALNTGYHPSLSIERIDTNGNYEPSNCKWATQKEQCNNRRSNHLLTHNGVTKTMTQWAEEKGISPGTLKSRIYKGWSVADAIETPVRRWT